ncbi:cytochrome c1 [Xanthobacter dioxanivorans]|uniref:Cytochrome c1 n=1 Tax=Xanthobacter dioxanivorans TaxID=2528964 RepID=A0A974PSP9_9HYPH|nr:cytochrome c1 [Xanthobacter dioxanivorans]QRG08836.1 cytochrome c1 [Xanthobacter dioxanivorans]
MTIRSSLFGAVAAAFLLAGAGAPALAAEGGGHDNRPHRLSWSFAGPFGMYDPAQLQRGFKVFKEVCAACHSANYLYFRNLTQEGGPRFTEAQAKQVAGEYQITDGPNDSGDMFQRPGRLSDHWPAPFPNDNAARAANGGALPPDFSVLAKARSYHVGFPGFITDAFIQYQEHGVDYIHALLTGYADAPADVHLQPGLQYNKYFPGNQIAMPKPISDGQVEYTDGAPQTVDQYASDVSAFMMWMAEPHLDSRKRIGFQVMIFLIVLSGLLYFTKKKIWSKVDH